MHHDLIHGKNVTEINDNVFRCFCLIVDLDVGGPAVVQLTVIDKLARPAPRHVFLTGVAGNVVGSVQGDIHALGINDLLVRALYAARCTHRAVVHKDLDLGNRQGAAVPFNIQLDVTGIDRVKGKGGKSIACADALVALDLCPALAVLGNADDYRLAKVSAELLARACGIDIHAVEIRGIAEVNNDLTLTRSVRHPAQRTAHITLALTVVEIIHILIGGAGGAVARNLRV